MNAAKTITKKNESEAYDRKIGEIVSKIIYRYGGDGTSAGLTILYCGVRLFMGIFSDLRIVGRRTLWISKFGTHGPRCGLPISPTRPVDEIMEAVHEGVQDIAMDNKNKRNQKPSARKADSSRVYFEVWGNDSYKFKIPSFAVKRPYEWNISASIRAIERANGAFCLDYNPDAVHYGRKEKPIRYVWTAVFAKEVGENSFTAEPTYEVIGTLFIGLPYAAAQK